MNKENLTHPCFPQLKENEKVWRYISMAKFINLITTRSLYFSRLDLLEDPFEGSYPLINSNLIYSTDTEKNQKRLNENIIIRKSIYINCWRYGDYESEAMWKLYCPNNDGIAIQTTYKKLVDSINHKSVFMGAITYLNYESESFQKGNILYPPMHKRKAFEHENEVRIIKVDTRYWNEKSRVSLEPPLEGLVEKWDLMKHCDALYVNPYASKWYYDTVKNLLTELKVNLELNWSKLKSSPVY